MKDHLVLLDHREVQLLGVHFNVDLLGLGLVVEANSSSWKWINLVEGVLNDDLVQVVLLVFLKRCVVAHQVCSTIVVVVTLWHLLHPETFSSLFGAIGHVSFLAVRLGLAVAFPVGFAIGLATIGFALALVEAF